MTKNARHVKRSYLGHVQRLILQALEEHDGPITLQGKGVTRRGTQSAARSLQKRGRIRPVHKGCETLEDAWSITVAGIDMLVQDGMLPVEYVDILHSLAHPSVQGTVSDLHLDIHILRPCDIGSALRRLEGRGLARKSGVLRGKPVWTITEAGRHAFARDQRRNRTMPRIK